MMSYSFLQIWLIFSRVFHVAYEVAPGRPEFTICSFAGAYRKAQHGMGLRQGFPSKIRAQEIA